MEVQRNYGSAPARGFSRSSAFLAAVLLLTFTPGVTSAGNAGTAGGAGDGPGAERSSGQEARDANPLVQFRWGVPDDVEMGLFEGLERDPEAREKHHEEGRLQVVWEKGESYILPLFAFSEYTLSGVRYFGSDIPRSFRVEWLDPFERTWYPLDEIPPEMVRVEIEPGNGHVSVNFGPPEGAAFAEDKVRFIWFRVTPRAAGEFRSVLFAFQPEDLEEPEAPESEDEAVSNVLILQAEVISPQ